MRGTSRRRLAKLHKWIGLSIALFVAAQCLTGLFLVWEAEINAMAAQGDAPLARDPRASDLPELLASSAQAYDHHVITRIDYPSAAGHPYVLHLRTANDTNAEHLVLAARQGDGFVLAESRVTDALAVAFAWHHELVAGTAGRVLVGLLGLSLLFMAVTGVVVWWPGSKRLRGSLKVSRGRPPVTFYWQLHRTLGVLALPLFLLSTVTGSLLAFRPWLQPSTVSPPAAVVANPVCEPAAHANRVSAAQAQLPGMTIRDLRFSADGSRLERVLFVNRNVLGIGEPHQVRFANCGIEIDEVRRANAPGRRYEIFLGWLYPVHTGLALGYTGRLGAAFAGCSIAGLLVTGGLLWFRRSSRTRRG